MMILLFKKMFYIGLYRNLKIKLKENTRKYYLLYPYQLFPSIEELEGKIKDQKEGEILFLFI